jgi:uncharacterized protein (DUF58 family)
MSGSTVAVASLEARRDSRPLAYGVTAAALLVVGLLGGRAEPIAAAAALAAVTIVGLARMRPTTVEATVDLGGRRVIEGDPLVVDIAVRHPPTHRVDLVVVEGSAALGTGAYLASPGGAGVSSAQLTLPTPEWGRLELGHLVLRAHVPGSMCVWERRLVDLGQVTVLPNRERLRSLLSPSATQATAGGHPASVLIGDGSDFVDIRAYQPGDRLRDVNWKATARRGAPQVNRRRPERGGEVVIVLDATADGWRQSDIGSELLQRAGQAVWSLARNHLAAQDRVGLMTQQSNGVEWLPPAGGVRAGYLVLETLLGASSGGRVRDLRPGIHRHDIPPTALVLGVSSLSNNLTLRSLAAMRAHGHTVGVLALDPARALHQTDALDAASLRLASMLFDSHVAYVRRLGLPVVSWRPGEDLDRSIARLAALTRRSIRRTTGVGA